MKLLALAIAPGLAIMIYIFWKDKYDREPKKLLIWAFILGVLSIIPAVILESMVTRTGMVYTDSILKTGVYAFAGIALIEEAVKFFVVFRFLYPKKDFNEPFDGITYSVMVSMGFATLENIAYTVDYGMATGVLRMFTAVPAHAAFGVIMGYYLGLAKFNTEKSNTYLAYALFIPAILHAAYDFSLLLDDNLLGWLKSYKILGALITLVIAILLSRRAIKIHQYNSPFNDRHKSD
ncbi:MAG: PrsW family intramembrane metalloprotease [Bacteroidetes bacterium]|jgi:protease PrsW|nr:PrsW family intramembrane metalloprotease [Bacteroidota bacterium]